MVTATDTVEISHSQRARLMDRVRRRDLIFKGIGVAFLAVSGALAWLLIGDPAGMMPGMPGFWKGAPMILGAVFFGIYGALLMVLRRFSLSAVLAAMFSAGLSAFGAQAFVRTITDGEQMALQFSVPESQKLAFIQEAGKVVTETRLKELTRDLRSAGVLEEPVSFDEAQIGVGTGNAENTVELSLRLTYCPFVHARQSPGRYLAMQYATLHFNLAGERTAGVTNANSDEHSREAVRIVSAYLSRRYPEHFAHAGDAARWMAARESDPFAKRAFEIFAENNTR